jgi:acetylornithine/succinyldiaminopimelate/putrescine aminotransferase
VVRLLPPLIIGEEEVRCATEAIERAASAFARKSSNAA